MFCGGNLVSPTHLGVAIDINEFYRHQCLARVKTRITSSSCIRSRHHHPLRHQYLQRNRTIPRACACARARAVKIAAKAHDCVSMARKNHFCASETFRTILPRVCRVADCSRALAASVSGNVLETTTLIFFCSIKFLISVSSLEFGATLRSEP